MKIVSKANLMGLLGLSGLSAVLAGGMAFLVSPAVEANLPSMAQRHDEVMEALTNLTLPAVEVEREITLSRGQVLTSVLKKAGFTGPQLEALVKASPEAAKPVAAKTTLTLIYKEGAPYRIETANLAFRPNPTQEVRLALAGTQASGKTIAKPLTEHRSVAVGRITNSLWADAEEAGLSATQIKEFMDIFAWDIDYTRDIHPGDTFKVTYEETQNDLGQRVKTGRILAAAFTVDGETRQAFWWAKASEYLNDKGESKRKLLLRTPLEVYRISSGFGVRHHPVLGYTKMHKGTDFAAPTGTPVKASGDGVITFIGPKGPNGNLIKIQHNAKFATAYAHLHRFSKGLRVGSRVKQGQIIAQVGTTGRSTGPHLHYEVQVAGASVNPMSTKLPTGNPLSRTELASFKANVNSIQTAWREAFGALRIASR